jgi:hypothetical protein
MAKYKPSIVQSGPPECFICHTKRLPLEIHHMIPGRGNKGICTELGLVCWLCPECHRKLHDQGVNYKEVQAAAQRAFIKEQKKIGYPEDVCRDLWYERFKKFYD